MFEAAVLLSHATKVRTPGVAAALQSGRRLHAVRRGRRRRGPAAARLRRRDPDGAAQGAPVVRVAEQPARRDRSGGRRDADVRGRADGARRRPGARRRRVRCVPTPSGGRGAVGGRGPRAGGRPGAPHRRRVRVGQHERARLRRRRSSVHPPVERAAVPAGPPRLGRRDPRAARPPDRRASARRRARPRTRTARPPVACSAGAAARWTRPSPPGSSTCTACAGPQEAVVRTPADAADAAAAIGGRVAVKALAPGAAAQGEARRRAARAARPRRRDAPRPRRSSPPRRGRGPVRRGSSSRRWRAATRCSSARSSTSGSARASRCDRAARSPRRVAPSSPRARSPGRRPPRSCARRPGGAGSPTDGTT